MGLRLNLVVRYSLMLFLASTAASQSDGGAFDVTKYGAKPDADSTEAFASAWKEACASKTTSKVVVPKGTYKLNIGNFLGPCNNPVGFELEGTLLAPPETNGDNWVTFEHIDDFTLPGTGIFDGNGKAGWSKNQCKKEKNCKQLPVSVRFNFLKNSVVKDITSKDSKNFHMNVLGCNNITFQHVTIDAPEDSPNTDGIHIGRSVGVNIENTHIATGDDCISLGDGSKQVSITDVTCGPGHGISIGSLGKYNGEEPVEGVTVKKCKLTKTLNGVRIKTWPASAAAGTASDMHFEDIEMIDVANPVIIDQEYCPWNQCNLKVPSTIKISKVSFKNIRGTSTTPVAVKLVCSSSMPCEGVEVADIDLTYKGSEGPISSECSNVEPAISGKQNPAICASPVITGASS